MGFIYIIENTINHRKYVGQSIMNPHVITNFVVMNVEKNFTNGLENVL